MALTPAERQQHYREKCKAGLPHIHYRQSTAVELLRELQAEYQKWFNLPESLQDSTLAEKLEEVCNLDLPKRFARD